MKVRLVLAYKGGSSLCLDTEMPCLPPPGTVIWELPGMAGWVEPFTCHPGESPCYLYREGLFVIAEAEEEEAVTEEEARSLLAAGWFVSEFPFGCQGSDLS